MRQRINHPTRCLSTVAAVTKRSGKLWRHVLGSANFESLYDEKDEVYTVHISKTRDKKYLFLGINSTDTTEYRYLRADHPQDSFKIFLPREKKHRNYVGHPEALFYIRTDKNAKNFQVVVAPEDDPSPKTCKVSIPHREALRIQV